MFIPPFPLTKYKFKTMTSSCIFFASLELNFIAASPKTSTCYEGQCCQAKLSELLAFDPHKRRLMSSSTPTLLFCATSSFSFFKVLHQYFGPHHIFLPLLKWVLSPGFLAISPSINFPFFGVPTLDDALYILIQMI